MTYHVTNTVFLLPLYITICSFDLFDKWYISPTNLNWIYLQVHCRTYQNLGNLSHHSFAAVLPGDSVAGIVVANGIINFLNIYNSLLVARLVLTWFPNAPPAIVSPLRYALKLKMFMLQMTCYIFKWKNCQRKEIDKVLNSDSKLSSQNSKCPKRIALVLIQKPIWKVEKKKH